MSLIARIIGRADRVENGPSRDELECRADDAMERHLSLLD